MKNRTSSIVDFVGASVDDMKAVIAQLKVEGHTPVWEDTTRLSSTNKATLSAIRKVLTQRNKNA